MKNWGLGLIIGAMAGVCASFIKSKNGKRIGAPIKKTLEESKVDASHLATAIKKAQLASRELQETLPLAKEGVSDIEESINNYQQTSQKNIAAIKEDAQKIDQKIVQITDQDEKM